MVPAESHARTCPALSTIVMIVLLNEAFTCAVALPTFLRSFAFFFSVAGLSVEAAAGVWVLMGVLGPRSLAEDLLVRDGLARALAAARVAARALPAHRETTAMAQAAVAVDLLQSVDVLHRQAAQSTLDGVVLLQVGRDVRDLVVLEVLRVDGGV